MTHSRFQLANGDGGKDIWLVSMEEKSLLRPGVPLPLPALLGRGLTRPRVFLPPAGRRSPLPAPAPSCLLPPCQEPCHELMVIDFTPFGCVVLFFGDTRDSVDPYARQPFCPQQWDRLSEHLNLGQSLACLSSGLLLLREHRQNSLLPSRRVLVKLGVGRLTDCIEFLSFLFLPSFNDTGAERLAEGRQ